MSFDEHKEWEQRRSAVIEAIAPICKAYGITRYNYLMLNGINGCEEYLELEGTKIGCTLNSISAIIDELTGYIFVTRYCKNRSLGAFEKQVLKVIKNHWRKDDN